MTNPRLPSGGAPPPQPAGRGPVLDLLDPRYGGRGDGRSLEDGAIARALADVPAGGGTVLFPPGHVYLVDSVRLTCANVTFLARGAILRKAPRTAAAMFFDRAAAADGFTCLGGVFELSRSAFAPGDLGSAFFFVRTRTLRFEGLELRDGVEEGIKLYKTQHVSVLGCHFTRIRNNGVQLHSPPQDGFEGTRPDQDAAYLTVQDCTFREIDDGEEGRRDGHGVAVHGTSPWVTTRDVVVSGCVAEACIRGFWAEFNPGTPPGRAISFDGNTVLRSRFHGLGLVGVHGGSLRDNVVRDPGARTPDAERTSSETFGLIVSGSVGALSRDVVVSGNEVVDARPPRERRMQYGIVVRQARGVVLRDNRVTGATVRDVEVDPEAVARG